MMQKTVLFAALRSALLAAAASLVSCGHTLADGEIGTPRVIGFVRGAPPDVQVLAPTGDRTGNIYVLSGVRDNPDLTVFVGRAGGGFSSGCRVNKGDSFGPHGWVGFASATRDPGSGAVDVTRIDRQWYWAGSALVRVTSLGDCRRVLDRDPSTGSDLLFDAVIPWVNDTSSSTTAIALVRATAEALPFTVIVDLNANIFTTPRAFEPPSARKVTIHGVGGSSSLREGFVLLTYEDGGASHTEMRFYDAEGAIVSIAPIAGVGDPLPLYGVRGYLSANDNGLVAGLLSDGRLVFADHGRGRVDQSPSSMEPVGVHAWNGALSLVGMSGGRPVVATINDDGGVSAPQSWAASEAILGSLGDAIEATDDRAPPRHTVTLAPARSTGRAPLVTEHSPFHYADGMTLITIAGPSIGAVDAAFSLVAVAPVGFSYP